MNLLISGGLLVIAAAAILGAILLSISEQRAQRVSSSAVKPTEAAAASSQLVTRKLEDEPALASPVMSTMQDNTLMGQGNERHSVPLNGQFRELADEIRTLHQQAWQLEQRLSLLTEMVDHIEREQDEIPVGIGS